MIASVMRACSRRDRILFHCAFPMVAFHLIDTQHGKPTAVRVHVIRTWLFISCYLVLVCYCIGVKLLYATTY